MNPRGGVFVSAAFEEVVISLSLHANWIIVVSHCFVRLLPCRSAHSNATEYH